jgi:hypothetical protein
MDVETPVAGQKWAVRSGVQSRTDRNEFSEALKK